MRLSRVHRVSWMGQQRWSGFVKGTDYKIGKNIRQIDIMTVQSGQDVAFFSHWCVLRIER